MLALVLSDSDNTSELITAVALLYLQFSISIVCVYLNPEI